MCVCVVHWLSISISLVLKGIVFFSPGYRIWLCHELCIPHVSHVIIHLWLWRKIHWLPASNSSVLLWPADCFNGVNSAPRPIAKPSHTPNCDQQDCQLVLKLYKTSTRTFLFIQSSGCLASPKRSSMFCQFLQVYSKKPSMFLILHKLCPSKTIQKPIQKPIRNYPQPPRSSPFFSTKHHRLTMDAAPSKRPVADPEGPILELLRVPGRTHRWKMGELLSSAKSKKMTPINTGDDLEKPQKYHSNRTVFSSYDIIYWRFPEIFG